MKQAKIKTFGIVFLILALFTGIVFAVVPYLISPADGASDDDGFLDLRGRCDSSSINSHDGTTNWNVTSATVYSNVDGTWKANATITIANPLANNSVLFNFTNHINKTAEGSFQWSIECTETNASVGTETNTAFVLNRTINVNYADPDVVTTSPADNSYDLEGKAIDFNCTAQATSGWNITTIELMLGTGGSWNINSTTTLDAPTEDEVITGFSVNHPADGVNLDYACRATQYKNISASAGNETVLVTSIHTSANRTLNIEIPPDVNLNFPASASWQTGASSILNFTPISSYTSETGFNCQLYTNESGTWAVRRSIVATNNTVTKIDYQLPDSRADIRWGVHCYESSDGNVHNASVNRTIKIDRTLPVVTLTQINKSTISDDSYFSASKIIISYSVTDFSPSSCTLFINDSSNATDTPSAATGNFIFNASDGVYSTIAGCSDSAGNFRNSTIDYLFTFDTVIPTISGVGNASVGGESDDRFFNFSSNEEVDATFFYGSSTLTTSSQSVAGYHTIINTTISGFAENTVYYWNITACDRAGNCNRTGESKGQFSVTFPWQLLAGWSYYGISDADINFSRIINESGAEYVYFWNQTGQTWISATRDGSSEQGFQVGIETNRHVVAIYEDVNSTWARNTTNTGFYVYNFTSGNNFIKLYTSSTFGNFTTTLLNESWNHTSGAVQESSEYKFGAELSQTPIGLVYNLTNFWFSAYNNTAVTWEPYYVYNTTLENNTRLIVPGPHEVMWVWSDYNLTWNGTYITGNWSI